MIEKAYLVELEDVSKVYRRGLEEVHALNDVSVGVRQGEFVAVVGPSGSGKSTLLYLMGCMDVPTSGVIRLAGQTINGLSEEALAKVRQEHIGFVFQQFFLMPTLSALENVLLPTLFSGQVGNGHRAVPKARGLLSLVGLSGRENHLPSQLSGGEMQRVAIARALVNQPKILLADEPTGNLDSQNAEAIFKLFRQLNREKGLTIAVVTHNLELAHLTDRVVRLKDGRIADGS